MRKGIVFGVCLLLRSVALCQQHDDHLPKKLPCFGDDAANALRTAFPGGVPGRTLPLEMKSSQSDASYTYIIPVVVHVMHTNGPERNVTEAQILSQIDVLNEGFGRYGEGENQNPLGGDVKIRFCLAKIDPDGNPTPGYDYTPTGYAAKLNPLTQDTLMKKLNQWDPNHYMNIWTVRTIFVGTQEYEGYTYIPEQVAGSAYDGIVLEHGSLGRDAGTATQRGKAGTHEAGHYFDLHHPWGDQAVDFCIGVSSDYCDDTPPVPKPIFMDFPTCLTSNTAESCDGGLRQVENYMDYNDDECQNLFTTCQRQRMHSALLRFRTYMASEENLRLTGCGQEILNYPAEGGVTIYPNPGSHYMIVNVDIEGVGKVRLEMYDFAGRRIYVKEDASYGRGPISLDVSQFTQGTYYIKVLTSKGNYNKKIFIANLAD